MEALNKTVKVVSVASSLLSVGSFNFSSKAECFVEEGAIAELRPTSRHLGEQIRPSRLTRIHSPVHGRGPKEKSVTRSRSSSRHGKERGRSRSRSSSRHEGGEGKKKDKKKKRKGKRSRSRSKSSSGAVLAATQANKFDPAALLPLLLFVNHLNTATTPPTVEEAKAPEQRDWDIPENVPQLPDSSETLKERIAPSESITRGIRSDRFTEPTDNEPLPDVGITVVPPSGIIVPPPATIVPPAATNVTLASPSSTFVVSPPRQPLKTTRGLLNARSMKRTAATSRGSTLAQTRAHQLKAQQPKAQQLKTQQLKAQQDAKACSETVAASLIQFTAQFEVVKPTITSWKLKHLVQPDVVDTLLKLLSLEDQVQQETATLIGLDPSKASGVWRSQKRDFESVVEFCALKEKIGEMLFESVATHVTTAETKVVDPVLHSDRIDLVTLNLPAAQPQLDLLNKDRPTLQAAEKVATDRNGVRKALEDVSSKLENLKKMFDKQMERGRECTTSIDKKLEQCDALDLVNDREELLKLTSSVVEDIDWWNDVAHLGKAAQRGEVEKLKEELSVRLETVRNIIWESDFESGMKYVQRRGIPDENQAQWIKDFEGKLKHLSRRATHFNEKVVHLMGDVIEPPPLSISVAQGQLIRIEFRSNEKFNYKLRTLSTQDAAGNIVKLEPVLAVDEVKVSVNRYERSIIRWKTDSLAVWFRVL